MNPGSLVPESMCSSPRGMMAPCLWPRPCFMGLHGAPGDIMCKACSLPLFILLSWLNALTPLVSVGPGRSLPFTEVPRRRSHPLKTKGKLRPCRGRQLQRLAFQSRAPFSALPSNDTPPFPAYLGSLSIHSSIPCVLFFK